MKGTLKDPVILNVIRQVLQPFFQRHPDIYERQPIVLSETRLQQCRVRQSPQTQQTRGQGEINQGARPFQSKTLLSTRKMLGNSLENATLCHRNFSNPKGLVDGFLNQFISFATKIRSLEQVAQIFTQSFMRYQHLKLVMLGDIILMLKHFSSFAIKIRDLEQMSQI